jgi:hypothetical protein
MRLTPHQSHALIAAVLVAVWTSVYFSFNGYGYYSLGFIHIERDAGAALLATIVCGILSRYWYVKIAPNTQGVQVFLGAQTGEVWGEGNFLFILRPLWDIWTTESVKHFSFTVAAQNRSKDGHQMMMLATGQGIPTDAFALAKIDPEYLKIQLLGLAQFTLGAFINDHPRQELFSYRMHNLSGRFAEDHDKNEFTDYKVKVVLTTTKVVEVNPRTMELFDTLARDKDMITIVNTLKATFPGSSDLERYAMYASMTGFTPAVMTHIIQGGQANVLLDSRKSS